MGKEQELFEAARNGQIDIVEKILNMRMKKSNPLASLRRTPGPNTQDSCGYTSLHYAALNGHKDVVQSILRYDANVNLVDTKGCTCLHLAAWAGHYEIVNLIIMQSNIQPNVNQTNIDGETALHCAAQFGHSSVCTLLIKNGADVLLRNSKNETSLDLACEYGRYETVEILLRLRPDLIDLCKYTTHSPLHLAAKNGHNQIVKLLLNANFDVNCLTENGTALHEAAFYGKKDVVQTLLDYGVNISLVNAQGKNVIGLLGELNTNVSRIIEKIIENHAIGNNQIQSPIDTLNKSISPIANYCDNVLIKTPYCLNDSKNPLLMVNFNNDLVPFSNETNQFNESNDLNDFYSELVMPPKQFQEPDYSSFDDNFNRQIIDITSNKKKYSSIESSLKNNFSHSQDSVLDDNLANNSKQSYLSTFSELKYNDINSLNSDFNLENNLNLSNPIPNLSTENNINDIYSSLDNEPIYCYPNNSIIETLNQNHSLKINFSQNNQHQFEQLEKSKIRNKDSLSKSVRELSYFQNKNLKPFKSLNTETSPTPQKPPRKCSLFTDNQKEMLNHRNSQSYHHLNYIQQNNKKIFTSEINYEEMKSIKSKPNQEFMCDMNYEVNNMKNSIKQKIKRSTSTTSNDNNHHSLDLNYSAFKRYSNVVNELKTNKLNENRSKLETVQRIKVNENDFYAQVDKRRKNSFKSNSHLINKLKSSNDFYDQPCKLIKPVNLNKSNEFLNEYNTSNLNQLNQYLDSDQKFSSLSNELKIENSFNENNKNYKQNTNNQFSSSNQTTFIKSKLNREKRATIAISLDEKSFQLINNFEPKLPSLVTAKNKILRTLKPAIQNYKRLKNKNDKGTFVEEIYFIKNDHQTGRKIIIKEKDFTINKQFLDQNTCTTFDEKEGLILENNKLKKNEKQDEGDKLVNLNENQTVELLDLNELNRLEEKLNELKINLNNQPSTIIRRAAPPPPPPVHAKKIDSNENRSLVEESKTIIKDDNCDNASMLIEDIIKKCDKNISTKEHNLLANIHHLPLSLDWKHDPVTLYKQTCHYLAFYLGSIEIKNLNEGIYSSQQCIKNYQKLLNENKLDTLSVVILSISYKSVRFVDVNCQKILNEHSMQNIHYACQDIDHFRFFAYITRDEDEQTNINHYNCHVFSTCNLEIANEILITLAQAFEIAFRISNCETIDQVRKQFVKGKLKKSSNNIPKPPPRFSSFTFENNNSNLSKSLSESQFNQLLITASNQTNSLICRKKLINQNLNQSIDSSSNSLNSTKKLKNLLPKKPIKLVHQRSLPETEFKNKITIFNLNKQRANPTNKPVKPMVPIKPSFK